MGILEVRIVRGSSNNMGNCVQGCFGNLKPLQPWLNWLVVVMELKYKLINKRHFSNQSFDSRREEKCYFVNTLKFSLTNSDSEMTRWPFQQWAFNSHQTCFFIIILLPNPLYIFCFILYPTTPYPLIYLWAPLRETERWVLLVFLHQLQWQLSYLVSWFYQHCRSSQQAWPGTTHSM